MSIVSLLHFPDDQRGQDAWVFDHAHEHGKLVQAMNSSSAFNLVQYLLDPLQAGAMNGAGMWDMNHQQAHDDASAWFSVKPSLPLIDSTTEHPGPFQWFLFANSQEHNALSRAASLDASSSG